MGQDQFSSKFLLIEPGPFNPAAAEMQFPALARAVPIAAGVVVLIASLRGRRD
jgi:hypothetical protein